MKRAILIVLAALCLSAPSYGQAVTVTASAIKPNPSASAPSGACPRRNAVLIDADKIYLCPESGTQNWTEVSGGGGGGGTTINSTNGQLPYRVNSTTFGDSAFASNALNSTYLQATSGASGAGLTLTVSGGGTNESLIITPRAAGQVFVNRVDNSTPTLAVGYTGVGISGPYSTVLGLYSNNTWSGSVSFAHGFMAPSTTHGFTWTTGIGLSPDTGLTRLSAGVLRASNASTGAGQLLIGTSTDTVSAQLDVRSQSTTRPAARFQAASTTSGTQEMLGVYDGAGTLKSYFRADGGLALGGNQTFSTDNTYDIGASGASRPANVNVGTSISIGTVDFTNAPLNIRANGAGLGFIVSRSATEYTEFISGGIEKGLRGIGTVPFKIKNDGDIFFVVGGTELLRINATTGLIQFSGTSASFPALKRSSTGLQVRLADDTDFAPFYAATVRHKAYTVATLPSAASFEGAIAYVTDANATTRLATVAGGGSNKVIVYSDGTNWVIL